MYIYFENMILRRIYRPTLEEGVWRRKLRQLYRDPEVDGEVNAKRLRWTGHLLRKREEHNEKGF